MKIKQRSAVAAAGVLALLTVPTVTGADTAGDADQPAATFAYRAGQWIDTDDRAAVITAFDAMRTAPVPDSQWTGNRASCTPGTTGAGYRAAIVARINYFRAMAGVPATVVEDPALTAIAQQGAIALAVDKRLTHQMPAGYACSSLEASAAMAHSNLSFNTVGPAAIDLYMTDPGPLNTPVRHRNYLLLPNLATAGVGDVPIASGQGAANVLWVLHDTQWHGVDPAVRESEGFVAWPNAGFVPGALVGPRWSFSLQGGDVSNAHVSLETGGTDIPVNTEYRSAKEKSGDVRPIVVWSPTATIDTAPAVDTTYTVTISNVIVAGQPRTYTYHTTIIGTAPSSTSDAAIRHAYILRAYVDFAGRYPTPEELSAGSTTIRSAGNAAFVSGLARSEAWRTNVIDQLYRNTLGRSGDPAGQAYWVGLLAQGETVADVAAAFYGSPEYVAGNGGNHQAWLTELYDVLLARTPDAGGIEYWEGQAKRTGTPHVAHEFYQSEESRRARVFGMYQTLLGRSPDPAGLEYWAGVLDSGDDLALAGFLAASDEYVALAQG